MSKLLSQKSPFQRFFLFFPHLHELLVALIVFPTISLCDNLMLFHCFPTSDSVLFFWVCRSFLSLMCRADLVITIDLRLGVLASLPLSLSLFLFLSISISPVPSPFFKCFYALSPSRSAVLKQRIWNERTSSLFHLTLNCLHLEFIHVTNNYNAGNDRQATNNIKWTLTSEKKAKKYKKK